MSKRFAVITAWALAAVGVLVLSALPARAATNLVSNVDGKIRVIILHYGDGGFGEGFWYDQTVLYRELLDKMDKDVGFVILTGKDAKAQRFKESFRPAATTKLPDGTDRVKFLDVEVKTSQFYPWARDPYFLLTDGQQRLIFLDAGFNEEPFPVTSFPNLFDGSEVWAGTIHRGGGNIRATDEEVFIGMDTLLGIRTARRYVEYLTESYDTLYDWAQNLKPKDVPVFRQKFEAHARLVRQILAPDRKLVIPDKDRFFSLLEKGKFEFTRKEATDTGAQAAYHTDVYLGVGGKDTDGKRVVFVADSRAGAKVVAQMSDAARREVERGLARTLAEEGFSASGVPIAETQIAARFEWDKNKVLDLDQALAKKSADRFDAAADGLTALGYHVVRIPYLPNGFDDKADANDGAMGVSFNYSNVLTEVYGETRKVYLPQFGFKELDEAAAAAYAGAGYQPVPIKGLTTNALSPMDANAGLDCLTSEIRFPVRWAQPTKK
jgi:hypothetical protein